MSRMVVVASALALGVFGVARGTWAVGGSDSSCYALMAQSFARGQLQPSSPLALDAPWPDAARSVAPAGFVPSPVRSGAASPVCAPGMSLLMAPLVVAGGRNGVFWVTPFAAAALVWFASVLATRLAGAMAGAVAAVLVAASPIVLFQAVQPMNDVVTAALWVAAVAVATGTRPGRAWACGALMGLALLVRPNLALVALVVGGAALASGGSSIRDSRRLAIGALPGVAVLLWLNYSLYGGAFASGYGIAAQLFSAANLSANAAHFARALYETQTLFPVLALFAPVVFTSSARTIAWTSLAAAGAVVVTYLSYRPYPEWWYLRFLLPAVVLSVVLASAVAVRVAMGARMGGVVAIGTVILALMSLRTAGDRQAFDLWRLEGRYADTAALVRDRLPERAVIITVWQSGSVRFHAGREAVLWDAVDPAWLDRAVSWLSAQGRTPYVLIERREEAAFRARFSGRSELGALDWPPRFDVNRQVRLFDPADRGRHLAGETYPTENIRPARR